MMKEDIQNIYDYSRSRLEIIEKCNIKTINFNKQNNELLLIFSEIGLNKEDLKIENLKNHWKEIEKRDYELNPNYCKWCGKKLPFEKRFSMCCNRSCAVAYSNHNKGPRSEETKKKIGQGVKNSEKYKINNAKGVLKRKETLIKKNINKSKDKLYIKKEKNKYNIIHIYTCKECGKQFENSDIRNITSIIYCSKECKHKYLSEHTGGYRVGSGFSKNGWYKGIRCDSTWELAFLIYHLDNNLYIERCKEERKYIYNGQERIYYPDFITDKGIVEIKGYKTDQSEEKRKQNSDIINIFKEDIQFYLDYVKEKYDKPLIELYDNSKPQYNFLNNSKYIWMHNNELKQNTMIYPEKYEEYVNLGWIHGRKKYNK